MSFFFRKPVGLCSARFELRRSLSADGLRSPPCANCAKVHATCEISENQSSTCSGMRFEMGSQSSPTLEGFETSDITPRPLSTDGSFKADSLASCSGLKETKEKAKFRQKAGRLQPNYFIAFRIKNQTILERLEAVQDCITKKNQLPKTSLVSLKKAHITLAVLRLDEVHCLHDARNALHAAVKEMTEGEISLSLDFRGLGTFSDRVLYARVVKNDSFARLLWIRECLVKSFRDVGISLTEENFSPHLTVAKLSYVSKKEAKKRLKIKLEDFSDINEMHFGTETVESIQLLKMKSSEDDGFYLCAEEIPLRSFSSDSVMECS
uniref:AKAP7_NLS domain-containing protein n=1 Tax=Trichuris muris TaxID=70415 RepID=A0A5S6QPN8_TRIMR